MKIITLLLMAVVSLPSMAQSKVKTQVNTNDERGAMTLVQKAFPGQNSKKSKKVAKVEIPAGYAAVTLTAEDVWGDGSGYQMLLDADANAFGSIIPESGALTTGGDVDATVYAEFEYKIPENADGALNTSNILIDQSVTILIPAGTYDWCITNPTPEDRVWIASSNGNVGGRADDFEFAEGLEYEFTVSLGGTNDQVNLEIKGIEFSYDVTNITNNSADAEWNLEGPASSVNLRYRKVNHDGYSTDFEDIDQLVADGWGILDNDGDDYNWSLAEDETLAHSGSTFFYSASYYNYNSLDPDNWLFTPEMDMSGKPLSFWARSYLESWPDNFEVWFVPSDDRAEIQLMESTTAPAEWTNYTIELPDDLGVGSIAFRHYDSYDKYYLFIDDVTIGEPDYEWVVVNGVTDNPYTISGLESGTEYEMQMQAEPMDWGEIVYFTTLDCLVLEDNADNTTVIADNQGYSGDVMLNGRKLYKDGNWNTICLPFDVTLEGSVLEGAIAKPISDATMTGKHVDLTFGDAVTALETGVPYIIKWESGEDIVNPVFEDVTISSTEGQTITLADGNVKFIGYFNPMDITADDANVYYLSASNKLVRTSKDRTLNAFRAYFEFTANTSSYAVNFNDGTDGITNVLNTVTNGETWFTIDGRQLSGKPAQKGVYVTNGQKVVIK